MLNYDELWDDPVYDRSLKWNGRFYEDTLLHQYLVCFSFAMMLNVGKDVSPISLSQTMASTLFLLFGIPFYGHMLSQFREVKEEQAELPNLLEKMSRSLVLALNDLNMTQDVREEASSYIKLISMIEFHQG